MKILFLVPYPLGESPSQRFRFEQYFSSLRDKEIEFRVQSFLTSGNWKLFFDGGNALRKLFMLSAGFFRRIGAVFLAVGYDYVFIHRELAPVGPPVFEWIIAKVLRKKIIYDFDDAIWLTDKINESYLEKKIRWRTKVRSICRWSYRISCGNEWLCEYARGFNSPVVYNPTTVDTDNTHIPPRKSHDNKTITIGWTGSHSTLKYLHTLNAVLRQLEERGNIKVLVIADRKPDLALSSLEFIPWSKETEAEDLSKIDIGIMPLPDDEWSKGKCGFKALQYMAMEIPCVVSAVGVNTSIINHGENGFLARSDHEWINHIESLIHDKELRLRIGKNGRQAVVANYSVRSNVSNFLALFDE